MLMKFLDIIINIMKIMWRDFKNIRSSRFRDIQKKKKLKVQILNEVAQLHLDRRWENGLLFESMILSSILMLLKNNLSHL